MKKIILIACMLLPVTVYAQSGSINNTLGSGGAFSIGDGATTFMSLSQVTGNLSLTKNLAVTVTSSSAAGVLLKGANRFLHDYQAPGTAGLNIFLGNNSGNFTMGGSGTDASFNTAVGNSTLYSLTTGNYNCAFGNSSLLSNTTGTYNAAFGASSLLSNTTGWFNSAFGASALQSNTTGYENSAFGYAALAGNISGRYNAAFGENSLTANTSGINNSAFGVNALSSNTTGESNSAFGMYSLSQNTTGIDNAAFGYSSLGANSTGNYNAAFGYASLGANTTGLNNSAFGFGALDNNTTGNSNSAFGAYSLSGSAGFNNAAFGAFSLQSNTTGSDNVTVGVASLNSNTTGKQNTAVGYKALWQNTSGFQNTAVGDSALYGNTGNYNTAIGFNAGSQVTSGANLTLIGIDANPSSGTAIDEITLGNGYVATLRCNTSTISSLSDARDKKNIRDLNLGLDFLMTVKPRLFQWDRREWYENGNPDGSKMKQEPTAGFIAQELDEAQTSATAEWLNLVLKTNPERLEATSGNLLPIMVKAIQELKSKNDQLTTELERLRGSIKEEVAMEVGRILFQMRRQNETVVATTSSH